MQTCTPLNPFCCALYLSRLLLAACSKCLSAITPAQLQAEYLGDSL